MERPQDDDAPPPSGVADEEHEVPPMGVPEGDEPERGPEGMPGIPTGGDPPAAS